MNDEERCIHELLPGQCSICNNAESKSLLEEAFDEVNAETEPGAGEAVFENGVFVSGMLVEPATSDTAVILTRVCVRPDCIHAGKFQDVKYFKDDGNVCHDCLPVSELIKKKNSENSKPGQKKWTDADIEFLRLNVDQMRNEELGAILGRTSVAVSFRLSSHGIKRKKRKKRKPERSPENIFDDEKFYLGNLCQSKHEFGNTGKTLRRLSNRSCQHCNKERVSVENKMVVDFTNHPDVYQALLDQAAEDLRAPSLQVIYILRKLQRLGEKANAD